MTALLAPALPHPEGDRLHQVLEDVRFLLERGCWQAALALTRDALNKERPDPEREDRAMSPRTQEATDA